MRIKRVCYPVKVLGPGKRVGIWVTGCSFNCFGCTSPELQDYKAGNEIKPEKLVEEISKIPNQIDGFTISGGEPFDQPEELCKLVELLNDKYSKDIIIYSGYTLEELKNKNSRFINEVLNSIAVLIDGKYVDSLNDDIGLRGSSNQTINIFYDNDKYEYMKTCKRELQTFDYLKNASIVIGIM